MKLKVALIAGATGAIGSALTRELSNDNNWTVYGLSRHLPTDPINGVQYQQVDLSDANDCQQVLGQLNSVTHVYYCGRATHAEQVLESAEDNLLLLRNLIETVESAANIQHVHLVQGGKYYGVHVGPFPTPAVEEQARAPVPNFNYDQQDYLAARAKTWTWTASRPNTLVHYSPHNARNLVSSLGVYACLCKKLGAALDFPGPENAFHSITQVTTLDLLARGMKWMSTTEACANQAFNITNTDVFRWSTVWPRLAKALDLPLGSVRPKKLADVMSERHGDWTDICHAHALTETDLDKMVNWEYLDATLIRDWDEILCHNKTRRLGFHDWDNSVDRIFSVLSEYQHHRLLPASPTATSRSTILQ